MKKEKVLIFSFSYYPFVGGAEVAIKEITDRIKDIDFDLITYDLKNSLPSEERVGNVNVYRINSFTKYLYPIKAFLLSIRLHKNKRYKASWSMMANTGFISLFLKIFFRLPYILTLQEGDPIPRIKRRVFFVYPIYRLIFKMANKVTAISKYLADFARDMGARNVLIIPNGVDLNIFKKAQIDREESFKDKKILITTGRLVKKNANEDVIRALSFLPDKIIFWILADGPDKNKLVDLAASLRILDRVFFLGYKIHKDMVDYLNQADIFIRPSLTEGLGNSFLEAMAIGLPIIGTPIGGIPDFLKDGETGLFCNVNDSRDIADKISKLLEDKELYKKISKNGESLIKERYDWVKISSDFRLIFLSSSLI